LGVKANASFHDKENEQTLVTYGFKENVMTLNKALWCNHHVKRYNIFSLHLIHVSVHLYLLG